MGVDEVLNLLGVDVLAAADNHILDAAGDFEVALGRAAGQIAGVEPAVLIDGGGCGLGHFVVALHDVVALGAELAVHLVGQILAGLRVHNLALDAEQGPAHGVHADIQGVVHMAWVQPGEDSVWP